MEPPKIGSESAPDPSRGHPTQFFILGPSLKAPGPENGPWGPKTTKHRGRRKKQNRRRNLHYFFRAAGGRGWRRSAFFATSLQVHEESEGRDLSISSHSKLLALSAVQAYASIAEPELVRAGIVRVIFRPPPHHSEEAQLRQRYLAFGGAPRHHGWPQRE